MQARSDFGSTIRRHNAPVAISLIALIVATFLAIWMKILSPVALAFDAQNFASRPWTALTHTIVGLDPLGTFFSALWLWGIGASVERDVRSQRLVIVVVVFAILSAALVTLGSMITGVSGGLVGAYPMLAMFTVMWATRSPESMVTFMFVIPVKAKWLAWISAGLVFFSTAPQLAVFAAAPLALAYFFAADKLPIPYIGSSTRGFGGAKKGSTYGRTGRVDNEFLSQVDKRAKEREERERLRKLFESGMIDNTGSDGRKAE